ncbi:Plpbp [Symbiodinium sp. CCMP2592]|nr:Plpbp [Symbiodinium sp. CCMP2592]
MCGWWPCRSLRPQKQCKQQWTWDRWISERIMCRSCWRKPPLCPPTWHFIGRLQSNKVKKLLSIPNLVAIETVDSSSLADRIASAAQAAGRGMRGIDPLDLFIQVDTSNEETKGGVQPSDAPNLASHIAACGRSVRLAGLMTIGAPGDMGAFDRLHAARSAVAAALGVPDKELGLSMGMSGDFQEAIRKGATSVRVGSLIFGSRPPK